MCIMLAFPEFIVATCTTNLFVAWINTSELKDCADVDGVPWSLTHTILANIGGIVLRFSDPYVQKTQREWCEQPSSSEPLGSTSTARENEQAQHLNTHKSNLRTVTNSSLPIAPSSISLSNKCPSPAPPKCRNIPGFIQDFQRGQNRHLKGLGDIPWAPYESHLIIAINAQTQARTAWSDYHAKQIAPLHGTVWTLDSKQLMLARRLGLIRKLPSFESNVIDDKSKSDGLIRCLAVIQVIWLTIQLIARHKYGMSSTALEISTLASAMTAFAVYIVEWPKPKDINVPFYIDADAAVSPPTFAIIADATPNTYAQPRRYYMPAGVIHQVIDDKYQVKHVQRFYICVTVISIMIFGGIHLFSWNFPFPTHLEQIMWRIAVLIVIAAPTFIVMINLIENIRDKCPIEERPKWPAGIAAPLYIISRVFMIVESFRSLWYLPSDAFIATWVANAPHVGEEI